MVGKTLPPSNKMASASDKMVLPSNKNLSPIKKTLPPSKTSTKQKTEPPVKNLLPSMDESNSVQYDEESPDSMTSPTPDVNQLKMQLDTSQEIIKDLEKKLDSYKATDSKKKAPVVNDQEEETIEPFSCGCDSNDARVSLIKYQKANAQDTLENFTNAANMDVFDVAGCKYDMGFKSQNDTYYGPPVSSCAAYNNINLEKTGTVFYPLN